MTPTARWLLGALVLSLPAVVVLAALVGLGEIGGRTAFLAALAIYAGTVIVARPLILGLAMVRAAVDALAAGGSAPEVTTLSPSVRELWLAIFRWTRNARQRLGAREAELGAAQAILAALPDPLILLDERRRIVRANAAANELLGMRLIERDLAVALRHPGVLAAADAVLSGEPSRIVEFDITTPVERHLSA